MSFSAYNSNGLRVLSGVLSDALGSVRKTAGHPLSEVQIASVSNALVQNLMKTHDSGERDPDALRRTALRALVASHADS